MWQPWQAGILNQGAAAPKQDFVGGLLNFLQTPQAAGLAQGLLSQGAPSMTEPRSFAGGLSSGLGLAQKYGDMDQKRKLAEAVFGLNKEKLGIDKGRFGLEQSELELKRQKYQQELLQQQQLMDLINGIGGGALGTAPAIPTPETIAKDVLNSNSATESNEPLTEEDLIVVTHPQLNNGQPTKVPAKLNGRPLNEEEAVNIALARKEEDRILKNSPVTGGVLNQPGASAPNKTGGILGEDKTEAQRKAILARGLILAGDKAGAIKALFGADKDKTLTGLPREYQSLKELKKLDPEAARMAEEELDLRRENQRIMGQSRDQITKLRKFNSLTADQKENVLSQGRTLGLGEQELLKRYSEGQTNYDIAKELGFTDEEAKHLDKEFAPTGATRTNVQSTEGALAEEKWIAPKITAAMKPYARKIFGTSPAFLKDAFSTNPATQEKVANALAARALQPEIAGFRSRAAGGSNAHGALQELTDKSLNELNVWEAQVAPEVYERAQEILSDWIHGMGNARVDAMKGVKRPASSKYSQSDLEYTAKKRGITVEEVIRLLEGNEK